MAGLGLLSAAIAGADGAAPAPAGDPAAKPAHDAGQVGQRPPPRNGPDQQNADRQPLLHQIEQRLACVCIEGGDLRIDASRGLDAASCPCPQAAIVRSHLAEALAPLDAAALADRRQVAEQIERAFVPMAAEYERVFRYPASDYAWWMDNVRCVCDGCKPTVFFSKCQLSCAPAIVYKARVRIFLSMGFSRDELLDYYLAEYNAGKPPREQKDRTWLLPRKQRETGWLVPVLAMTAAIGVLGWSLRRWTRRTATAPAATTASPTTAPTEAVPHLTAADRQRLQDALDRDDEEG
jgi:hypothetical protein